MALSLPYYYGHSGEQYAFFRIPKLLITDSRFDGVSSDAKLLYGLLLDRMELSYRNGWVDDQNRVFIIFTVEEVMETLRCRSEKAVRLFRRRDQRTASQAEYALRCLYPQIRTYQFPRQCHCVRPGQRLFSAVLAGNSGRGEKSEAQGRPVHQAYHPQPQTC